MLCSPSSSSVSGSARKHSFCDPGSRSSFGALTWVLVEREPRIDFNLRASFGRANWYFGAVKRERQAGDNPGFCHSLLPTHKCK